MMTFKKIFYLVIIWRLLLTACGAIAPHLIAYQPSFPYADSILPEYGSKLLYSWANFDGVHYLTIIQKGYFGTGAIQAFFPLYPLVIRAMTSIVQNPITAGIIVSIISLTISLYFLQKLLIIDHQKKVVIRIMLLILLFPTAFFFTSLYTESIFFMLSVMSFYFARKRQFLLAAICAALASATRVTGILLFPALLIEYFDDRKVGKLSPVHKFKDMAVISLSSVGLISFMVYLHQTFNDALLFLHVQSQFGAGRQTDKLVMLYQVFYRYIKMAITVQRDSLLYYTVLTEFVIAIIFLTLLILAFKYTRKSYAFYAIVSFIIPTLTGTFTSLPRYVLVLFPAFIVAAKIIPPKYFPIVISLSGILLIINTILFIQGIWIA